MTSTSATVDGLRSPAADLPELFATMALIRVFEERLLDLRRAGEVVGPVHPYIGQEAVATGVCAALSDHDTVVSHYRGHGHALARGVDLDGLTAELFGKATGVCGGKAAALIGDPRRNLLMSSGIVGAGIPVAAGAAMAAQVRGDGAVAVVFFGDGALGSGVVHETLNLASVQRLPLVLVCEHNGYQAGNRTEDVYPEVSVLRIAEAHRVRAVGVDGNDVLAVAAVARDAVAAARAGDGPTFIEARTYLTKFHLQFERPSPEVRPPDELAAWQRRDPLEVVLGRAAEAGHELAPATVEAAWADARARVDRAVRAAGAAPWPAATEVFTHVLAGAA